VDGHRLNDNVYEGALIGTEFPVDVDLIRRVEVIRGPGSSLYGSNAFFAVINVITKRGNELKGFETSGEAGSFNTYKGRITYGNGFSNGMEAFLSGSAYDSRGQRLYFREFDAPETNNGVVDRADYDRSAGAFAKLSIPGFTLESAYSSRTKGLPTGSYGADFNDRRNKTIDAWWFVDLKYEHTPRSGLDMTGRLFFDDYEYRGDYLYSGVVNKDSVTGKWWGGEIQVAATMFERHKLILGSEFRDNLSQDQKTYDEDPYVLYIDDKRKSQIGAAYIQDEYTILKELIVNAGVRYDHYSTFGSTVNPRLALISAPFEKTVFKLLYGSAFRAPNDYELYYESPIGQQKANPGLRPEKITSYEFIAEHQLRPNIRLTASAYYNEIRNLIGQVIDPADSQLVFRNSDGLVTAKGVEVEAERAWAGDARLRGSYAWQFTRDRGLGKELDNSPRHLAKLNFSMPLFNNALREGAELQYTGSRKTLGNGTTGGAVIANVTLLTQKIAKGLEVSASVYNLFDRRYADPSRPEHLPGLDVIQQDGRSFRTKLTYRF